MGKWFTDVVFEAPKYTHTQYQSALVVVAVTVFLGMGTVSA